MPQCKNCQKIFPNRVKIDGQYKTINKRSYCLECSPVGEHRFYKNRNLYDESGNKKPCEERICTICNKKIAEYWKGSICPTCCSYYRRYKNRNTILIEMGGKCSSCNIDDFDVLQIHHLNEDEKTFTFAGFWAYSLKMLRKEAEKCILLCSNCHSKIHSNRNPYHEEIIDYFNNKSKK